jgi:competence protein CoiA
MQLFALDSQGKCISAKKASKQIDYSCFECQSNLRLRRGLHRQAHFYHINPSPSCRQHQKGAIHLQLQSYFFDQLPHEDCMIEYHIPAINRIADVAWLSKKIVFEIQYSFISAAELMARNLDYRSAGWTVYWILHDSRYNQYLLSSAEMALTHFPHFYSNFDFQGKGMIYDQFDIRKGGKRIAKLPPLQISIQKIENQPLIDKETAGKTLYTRSTKWPYRFSGDLLSLYSQQPDNEYIAKAIELEQKHGFIDSSNDRAWWKAIPLIMKNFYKLIFHYFLEKACR